MAGLTIIFLYSFEVGELYEVKEVNVLLLLMGPAMIAQAYFVQQITRSSSASIQVVLGFQFLGLVLVILGRLMQGSLAFRFLSLRVL